MGPNFGKNGRSVVLYPLLQLLYGSPGRRVNTRALVATDAYVVANRNEGKLLPGQENKRTDSDEDVILVSEKCAPKFHEITFDQAKRLALQRDIDEQSQPQQLAKPLTSQRSTAVERPEERVKMKMDEEQSEEKLVKKQKKQKKGKIKNENCPVGDGGSQAEAKKEKKKGKKVNVVVIDIEEESGGKEEKEIVTESLNDASGLDVKTENDEEVIKKKKKKKKKLADGENQVETVQISLKEDVGKKHRKEKKAKNKSLQIKSENVKIEMAEEEQQAESDKLPKKAKKRKNNALVVRTEETEEQVTEKKKKKKKESTDVETAKAMDEISVTKKKKKDKTKVAENLVQLETPEGETGEVEEVKKSPKKRLKEKKKKKDGNEVGTPQIKGKLEIVTIEEEEMELKKKGKQGKGRKASMEIIEVEETEPKKKKRKKGNSKGEQEEPPSLKCEGVEEPSGETPVTGAVDTASKKKKMISSKAETQVENVSFETSAKKKKKQKKIKEEVEAVHESPQVDVVFMSAKSGNTDEITINQERRQALQMEIDQASQPQKPAKPTGLGQWSTAQFDSSDQQQKFLRLMGGFKKGFQPAAGSPGRANMALGKDAQQQLQQGLLGEFERAHSRRIDFNSRGTGLGFTAPSNKKFFIDVNASRSVRFDD
ncbi:uncharacterized protein knop1 [Symphorus nematophorus]